MPKPFLPLFTHSLQIETNLSQWMGIGQCVHNFQMQKHNEWLSNKGYLRHLQVLNKISQRKAHSLNRTAPLRPRPTLNDSKSHEDATIRKQTTTREQLLLWDNYQLGKRIIETPPVISKKKMDAQYRRHKLIVQSMAASSSRKTMPTDFRVKKLQQYKENVEQHIHDLAQQSAAHHHSIRISITGLTFYRQGQTLDNLALLFIYPTKTGKRHRQTCDTFPAGELTERAFFFSITKRLINEEQPLVLQLRNLRGLELFSIGYISFPSGKELINHEARLFHCGKAIGEVEISTAFNKRGY